MKTVLVTGIGGNVGQGILRCLRAGFPDFKLVGTNTVFFNSGSHLCDRTFQVPLATDPNFIDAFNSIVESESVDLVLPATDYETYYLSKHANAIHAVVATSPLETCERYLDKYSSWLHHQSHGVPFATSCLPSEFEGQFENWIVKPREGRGSRGLHISPTDTKSFGDDEYLVQELLKGPEFTTAFYVRQDGALHGHVTMERELSAGATTKCRIATEQAKLAEALVNKLIAASPFRGSANVQSILHQGELIPFEINCRISGTNSIRHHFGFQDVVYTVEERLLAHPPHPVALRPGVATRILMDVIYQDQDSYPENDDASIKGYLA